MHARPIALPIIEREWPALACDLIDGLDVGTVRDRAADTFDGEEYGRLCALLEVYEAELPPDRVTQAIIDTAREGAAKRAGGKLTDSQALDVIAAKLNEPGQWNGGDVCELAAEVCQRTGRTIATD